MRTHPLLLAIPFALLPMTVVAQVPSAPPAPSTAPVAAQEATPAAEEAEDHPLPTTYGSLDMGVRSTHLDGDGARYERYRDLGDGLFLERARFATAQRGWMFDLGADHDGSRAQRYDARAALPGRLKLWGRYDQIPMLMSRTTRTLFTETSPGVLEIDNAIQAQVQAQAAYLATAVQTATRFDLGSRRHIASGGAEWLAGRGVIVSTHVQHMNRDGDIPFGGSFGHGNVVETFAPVQHTLTDFDSSAEYAEGNVLARGGYTGSWFHNDVTSLTFDNPWRVTDSSSAGSRGRTALAPSNSFVGVNGLLSYKLPYRSRASVYGSLGSLHDAGAPLLPFTVNTTLPVIPLDRSTTDGHARTSSINLSFTSRPVQSVDVDLRFRTYDYDNRTPQFLVTQRVGYDNAVSAVTTPALQETEPFGVKRATFDADVRLSPVRAFSAGAGFGHQSEERTYRIFEKTTDDTVRVLVDSVGHKWLTLRSKYEHTQRRGEGDVADISAELLAIGEQPGMRHYDIASRNRDRVTLTAGTVPFSTLSFNGSVAAGKDDYLESLFGLRDNHHRVYSLGMDYAPSDYYGAGLSYSFERYTSLSRSRQANPGVQFDDPTRNWATDTADRAHSVIAHAEMKQFRQKFDINLFADYNRTRGLYQYITGPVPDRTLPEEVPVPTSLPNPTQLPLVKSELARGNVDVMYALSERWGIGVSVWYERYRVSDFTLDADAQSRLDPAGALLLGYQYLPYTATTVWGRAVYKF
jgi:MtrB/PioB family decaheme-associated outer membrane protein